MVPDGGTLWVPDYADGRIRSLKTDTAAAPRAGAAVPVGSGPRT